MVNPGSDGLAEILEAVFNGAEYDLSTFLQ